MNLMDLAIKIGVDDQASSAIDKLTHKVGDGLKAAAKVGIAAVAAIGTATVAYVKSAEEAYSEYEQLAGGIETLYKNGSQKIEQYASEAFKTAGISANKYREIATSFAGSLLQSLAMDSSEITRQTSENFEDQLNAEYEALENSNDQKLDALKKSHEEELNAFNDLTDRKIALIDKQYMENLKLIDEEKYNRLKAIDDEIAALEGLTEAERDAAEQQKREEEKAALERKVNTASNTRFRKAAEKELSDYLEKISREDNEKERKAKIEQLESEKDLIEEEYTLRKEELKNSRDAEIEILNETAAHQIEVIKNQQEAEMESIKSSNKLKLEEMKEYISAQKTLFETSSSGVVSYTEKNYSDAADYAQRAITDMSDNANKLGTDIGLIQNAYQGFSKQNYTMLDNLKLGYGGTQAEMERLVKDASEMTDIQESLNLKVDDGVLSFANIVNAIHVVQTKLGITGTTSEESATTISGSIATMEAAWENLKTGVAQNTGDMDVLIDDFVTATYNAGTNIIDRTTTTIEGIKNVFSNPEQRQKFIDLGKDLLKQISGGIRSILGIGTEEDPIYWAGQTAQKLILKFTGAINSYGDETTNSGRSVLGRFFDGLTSNDDDSGRTWDETLGTILGNVTGTLAGILEDFLDIVTDIISGSGELVRALLSGDWDTISGIFNDFTNAFLEALNPNAGVVSRGNKPNLEYPTEDPYPEFTEQFPTNTWSFAPKQTSIGDININVNANTNATAREIGESTAEAFQQALDEREEANG